MAIYRTDKGIIRTAEDTLVCTVCGFIILSNEKHNLDSDLNPVHSELKVCLVNQNNIIQELNRQDNNCNEIIAELSTQKAKLTEELDKAKLQNELLQQEVTNLRAVVRLQATVQDDTPTVEDDGETVPPTQNSAFTWKYD